MRVIFFGTPRIAADVLGYLVDHGVNIVAVVTKPDKPRGRTGNPLPPEVKVLVQERLPNVPIYQPEKASDPEFASVLEQHQPDLFVVVAYGEIIKQHLLEMPSMGCINLHASLLPKYRGAGPIQRCIMEGDAETGVTIMHMARKMDAGDIIKQVRIGIPEEMTGGELTRELARIGKEALLDVIRQFQKGNVARIPQDHEQATHAPKIELEDCEVNWNQPAWTIHNLIRACNPHPGAWCKVLLRGSEKRLKLHQSEVVDAVELPIGAWCIRDGQLIVSAQEGALRLKEIQLEGKKRLSGEEFLRGISSNDLSFQVLS